MGSLNGGLARVGESCKIVQYDQLKRSACCELCELVTIDRRVLTSKTHIEVTSQSAGNYRLNTEI